MKITSLPQYTRSAKRLTEIVATLARYQLAGWLSDSDPDFINNLLHDADGTRLSGMTAEERVRSVLTALGPTFIKLGQVLSTRPDLVGTKLADELSTLQSGTPADSPEQVREMLESELGQPVESLFDDFEWEALASASIGQVHPARLKDGRAVVVKVQHHGIEKVVAQDLDILEALAELAETYSSEARLYQARSTVVGFRKVLEQELDFNLERRNVERFARNFRGVDWVHFPEVHAECSSKRVLTMERLAGFSVGDTERLEVDAIDTAALARRGASLYLDMIFRDGFYHADPHPGNIWVLAEERIGILDCGMVGRIDERLRDEFEGVMLSLITGDADGLMEAVLQIGTAPDDVDRTELRSAINDYVAQHVGGSLKDFDVSAALDGVVEIIRRHRIVLPPRVALLIKVLIMLEGTSRKLNRDFSLAELLQPYQRQMIQRRFSPRRLLRRLHRSYRQWDRLVEMLPRGLVNLIERTERGRIDINLNHRRLDTIVNRLVYGIMVAALFLGSSQLWSSDALPMLFGIPVFGALGCAIAIVLGVWLMRAIGKSGGLRSSD